MWLWLLEKPKTAGIQHTWGQGQHLEAVPAAYLGTDAPQGLTCTSARPLLLVGTVGSGRWGCAGRQRTLEQLLS